MKKLTKILSVIMAMLILNNNVYATEGIDLQGISKYLDGGVKYIAMVITVVIMAIIIYIAYRADKKEDENNIQSDTLQENDYPYEQASVSESGSLLDEDNISTLDLVEEVEYEEESLYNTAKKNSHTGCRITACCAATNVFVGKVGIS